MISISLHVDLYEYKQSHVSDVLNVRMTYICKLSGSLITKYQSNKTIDYISGMGFPIFHILTFLLNLIGLL